MQTFSVKICRGTFYTVFERYVLKAMHFEQNDCITVYATFHKSFRVEAEIRISTSFYSFGHICILDIRQQKACNASEPKFAKITVAEKTMRYNLSNALTISYRIALFLLNHF